MNGLKLKVNRFNTSGVSDFISFDGINALKSSNLYKWNVVASEGMTEIVVGTGQENKESKIILTFVNYFLVSVEYKVYKDGVLEINTLYGV